MNPEPDHTESDFTEHLESFSRAPLPESWKKDLIAIAQSPEQTNSHFFTRAQVVSAALIGSCWILIALLHLTTPSSDPPPQFAASEPDTEAAKQFPLVVHYLEHRHHALTKHF